MAGAAEAAEYQREGRIASCSIPELSRIGAYLLRRYFAIARSSFFGVGSKSHNLIYVFGPSHSLPVRYSEDIDVSASRLDGPQVKQAQALGATHLDYNFQFIK